VYGIFSFSPESGFIMCLGLLQNIGRDGDDLVQVASRKSSSWVDWAGLLHFTPRYQAAAPP
jgi:hypothetical protein